MRSIRGQIQLPTDDDPILCVLRDARAAHRSGRGDPVAPGQVSRGDRAAQLRGILDAEIAESLRLIRATVKSRIHCGREMVREYLADWRGDDDAEIALADAHNTISARRSERGAGWRRWRHGASLQTLNDSRHMLLSPDAIHPLSSTDRT